MDPGYHFVDDLWDVWDKGRHSRHSVGKKQVAKSTWAADVNRAAKARQAAHISRGTKFLSFSKTAIGLGSWFVPGLGTYKAAKAGHKFLTVTGILGDVALLAWAYQKLTDKNSVKSPEAHVDPFLFENIVHHDYVQGYNATPISPWRTM